MRIVFLIVALSVIALQSHAEFKPLYEVNLVTAGGWLPDYPGADQHHFKYLFFPWGVYRGEYLKADSDGLQADVVKETAAGIDVSLSGSFPSSSEDNRARNGMEDLHTMIEFGPRIYLRVETEKGTDFRVNLPVRSVFSTNLKFTKHRGYIISPGINYRKPFGGPKKIGLTYYNAINFATEPLNDFFYEVTPDYATSSRPAYNARSGYLGTTNSIIVDFTSGSAKYLISVGAQSYRGSANEKSPLHLREIDYTAVIGIIWTLYKSKETEYQPEPRLAASSSSVVR